MVVILETRFDATWGGLEKAPKFVMPTIWMFLLRYYAITKKTEVLNMVTHTLVMMSQAGLYDQLGGGFARYSTDGEWLAPHFEKMLYDNALLVSVYAEAYQLTKNKLYAQLLRHTAHFIKQEMQSAEGAFYSAYDADSEGVEGKYYTWTEDELKAILGEGFSSFRDIFSFTQ